MPSHRLGREKGELRARLLEMPERRASAAASSRGRASKAKLILRVQPARGKLLEEQKDGKKRMRQAGKVENRRIDLNCCPEEGRRLRRVLGGALSEGSDLRIGTSTKRRSIFWRYASRTTRNQHLCRIQDRECRGNNRDVNSALDLPGHIRHSRIAKFGRIMSSRVAVGIDLSGSSGTATGDCRYRAENEISAARADPVSLRVRLREAGIVSPNGADGGGIYPGPTVGAVDRDLARDVRLHGPVAAGGGRRRRGRIISKRDDRDQAVAQIRPGVRRNRCLSFGPERMGCCVADGYRRAGGNLIHFGARQ
jgi:hypothetical protein